jgi:hypothetical protein
MILKKTINRFEKLTFKTIIKPFFVQQGFKFLKQVGTKKIGDFELTISCYTAHYYSGIYYNPTTQTAEIQFDAYLRVAHPVFYAWCDAKYQGYYTFFKKKNDVQHKLHFILPIDIALLSEWDFLDNVRGNPINGLRIQNLGYPSFLDMMHPTYTPNWYDLIAQTTALADLETIFCSYPDSHGKYLNLIYRQELEKAKIAVAELWQLRTQAYHDEQRIYYKAHIISELKQLQVKAKDLLDLDFVLNLNE